MAEPTGHYPSRDTGAILEILHQTWGHAECELDHANAFELLIATILSAQSTDKGVNKVTPVLFKRFPDAAALAEADLGEVEEIIHPTGFYRNKAKNIVGTARILASEHGGEVPKDMKALVALPGVARKTANVVLGVAYGIAEGFVVDTHVKRVSQRLGLAQSDKPPAVEKELMQAVPKAEWITTSQELIWHGRRICHAKKADCDQCPLAPLCPSIQA